MITNPRTKARSPIIHMNMLHLCSPLRNRVRNEYMIELFSVLVKDVCVSLDGVNTGDFIQFADDTLERSKDRPSLKVFVKVTGDDDACLGV